MTLHRRRALALLVLLVGCTRQNPSRVWPLAEDADSPTGSDLAETRRDLSQIDPRYDLGIDLAKADLARGGTDLARGETDLSGGGADFAQPIPVVDMAQPLDFGPLPDLAGRVIVPGGPCGVKINEIMVATLSGTTVRTAEEFVELFNTCDSEESLAGWKLLYRSQNNNSGSTNPSTPLVDDLATTIGPHQFRVFGSYQLPAASRDGLFLNTTGSSLADDGGGGVAIVDAFGHVIDSVAWGSVVITHNFIEGSGPAPFPTVAERPGNSIVRISDGFDLDDNARDFFMTRTPTPKAPNVLE